MFARLTCQAVTKRAADGNPLAVTPKTRFNVCRVLTVARNGQCLEMPGAISGNSAAAEEPAELNNWETAVRFRTWAGEGGEARYGMKSRFTSRVLRAGFQPIWRGRSARDQRAHNECI
jgi:hypothetical protein